jgi:hypothetical protein
MILIWFDFNEVIFNTFVLVYLIKIQLVVAEKIQFYVFEVIIHEGLLSLG